MKTWQEEGFDSPEQQISVHAIRAKLKLQTGDYCEVMREQAIDILNIEGYSTPEAYVEPFVKYDKIYAWWHSRMSIIISGFLTDGPGDELSFPDFKQRLINTLKK